LKTRDNGTVVEPDDRDIYLRTCYKAITSHDRDRGWVLWPRSLCPDQPGMYQFRYFGSKTDKRKWGTSEPLPFKYKCPRAETLVDAGNVVVECVTSLFCSGNSFRKSWQFFFFFPSQSLVFIVKKKKFFFFFLFLFLLFWFLLFWFLFLAVDAAMLLTALQPVARELSALAALVHAESEAQDVHPMQLDPHTLVLSEEKRTQVMVKVREVLIVHVGGTRCVPSSTGNIMKRHARITLTVEFIRTRIFLI
jgi:hypothetical protein